MSPSTSQFIPAYKAVFVLAPNGQLEKINPIYCATDETAQQLAVILADLHPQIIQRFPLGGFFGGFIEDALVPWFQLRNPNVDDAGADNAYYHVNAGLVASYWSHMSNPAVAERMARVDVSGAAAYYATQPER